MDTTLLKNFLVLAKTKNFTKAAQKLHLSQSAMSLQIGRLETLLKKQLFLRDKRNVTLTAAAEELVGYAHQLLKIEEEMITHFQKPSVKGEVTLGTPEDLATSYLPKILASFAECHPEVLVNVHCEFTMNLLNGFNKQSYDLVLIKQDPKNPHPRSEEVWKEPLVWVCKKQRSNQKLEKEPIPLILAPQPCVYRQRALDALNEKSIRWRIVYTSPSLTGTLAAVKAGLGIAVLPLNMVPKELEPIETLPSLKDGQIALLQQENPSDAAKALATYVIDHMRDSFSDGVNR